MPASKKARRQHEAATETLYQEYEQLSQQLHPERSSKQNELTALDYQMQPVARRPSSKPNRRN